MSKQQTENERYWQAKNEWEINTQYKKFLVENKEEASPDSAQIFASIKIGESGGYKYMEKNERELILLLAGKLPEFYD